MATFRISVVVALTSVRKMRGGLRESSADFAYRIVSSGVFAFSLNRVMLPNVSNEDPTGARLGLVRLIKHFSNGMPIFGQPAPDSSRTTFAPWSE